jgi:NitT/TauT family transport system permease protein
LNIAEWLKNNAQTISVFVLALLIWHFSVVLFGIKEYILPTPLAAIKTLFDPKYRWSLNFLATFYEVVGGFILSAVVGVILGVAMRNYSDRQMVIGAECSTPFFKGQIQMN